MQQPPQCEMAGKVIGWEYIVDDYLELVGGLSEDERLFVIDQLRREGTLTDRAATPPALIIDRRLVLIADAVPLKEMWLYSQTKRKIMRFKLEF